MLSGLFMTTMGGLDPFTQNLKVARILDDLFFPVVFFALAPLMFLSTLICNCRLRGKVPEKNIGSAYIGTLLHEGQRDSSSITCT